MQTVLVQSLIATLIAIAACALLLPALVKWSPRLRLVDIPNERKLHRLPIPSIGGLVMMLSLMVTYLLSPGLQQLMDQYWPLGILLLVLMVLGVLDDRLNLPSKLRFVVQFACAYFVCQQDLRLHSLHGILGIDTLPVFFQYALSIIIIVGLTNAFNLIDGIDGLAGSMAFINLAVLAVFSYLIGQQQWLFLLLPFCGALGVFLKYNWRPAKLFMGDGGSLVLGFLMAVLGISLVESSYLQTTIDSATMIVATTATMMIPALDTLRVFYVRLSKGKSPFSADKNHLHHWLIRQHLVHSQATSRVVVFHALLIVVSLLAIQVFSITAVVLMQGALVVGYTKMLQLSLYFHRWYRFIKKMETA